MVALGVGFVIRDVLGLAACGVFRFFAALRMTRAAFRVTAPMDSGFRRNDGRATICAWGAVSL